jgi:transaldolase/glucose-6-phosphate isomerase
MATQTKVQTSIRMKELLAMGQSAWLDYIRRNIILNGELKAMIANGLRGVTSNPSIFEKAIAGSTDYSDLLDTLPKQGLGAPEIFERIAIRDIQDAADQFAEVYRQSGGKDGFVSLEVSPLLARDTQGTIEEARRLWKTVSRPNVMIKVPGAPEGIPAIEQLTSEGININVTLLFAIEAYEQAARAYINGLKKHEAKGGDVSKISSVASFFLSRIDTAVDAQLEKKLKDSSDGNAAELQHLLGKTAIANAKLAYKLYERLIAEPDWKALAAKGAQVQRLLWASTGTKNPKYPDTMYIDALIGPDTVNTIPPATLDAFLDHGTVANTLATGFDQAEQVMAGLKRVGISIEKVTADLLEQGIKLFEEAFSKLLEAVEQHRPKIEAMQCKLPADADAAVKANLAEWDKSNKVKRFWEKDASLWTSADEAKWTGWLTEPQSQLANVQQLIDFQNEVKARGFSHALLLGMGGSSLCPEVTAMTFGKRPGFPELMVLDSTDPEQVRGVEKRIDIKKTLFIVSSKSGSTLEPNIFRDYFLTRAKETVGDKASQQFIAITDPGSQLEKQAKADGFWKIFPGVPSIGGRYSALSNFGMVPAAAAGVDVREFLDETGKMVQACSSSVAAAQNPGVLLGVVLGTLAKMGRDKVTIISSPGIADVGAWLEQLIAESTGKVGKGMIPVAGEPLGGPAAYGNDRVFAYLRLASKPDAQQDAAISALETAGHPVVRIELKDIEELGQEYFRWEVATAVAGAIIGINPFDQPDVEASKIETLTLTTEYEKTGSLPAEKPFFEADGIKFFADDANAKELSDAKSPADVIKTHLNRAKAGDYAALLAYVPMNAQNEATLEKARLAIRDARKLATCVGFGPRFLHSTGQAYKGGPNSGVFLQITCDHAQDLPIPGRKFTFGVVQAAQARGDFAVLSQRKRRALRVHFSNGANAAERLRNLVTG